MATGYVPNADQGAVRYSGRRGRATEQAPKAAGNVATNSPVWPLAAVIFAVAWLQHGFWLSIGCVIAQLAVMTAGQWLLLYVQRNAIGLRLRNFRSVPALKAIRLGTFAVTLGLIIVLA
jgi:hypothetical protein